MAGSYQTTNPQAIAHPLRSVALLRPACQVLGWTAEQKATYALQVAKNNLEGAELNYASACRALGEANKMRGKQAAMRRYWQAKAFRRINVERAQLRAARAALLAALAAAPAGLAS